MTLRPALLLCALLAAASGAHAQITFRAASQAAVAAPAAAPAFQAAGTAVTGTGAVTPTWPPHQAGDVALLFVESAGGEAANLSTPAGFAAVPNSPQSTGAGTAGTRLTVYWARATSAAMANPTVADPGNHVYARILTYRGVIAAGNPWDATAGGVKAAASTSVSVAGVTTTVVNTRIVQAVARDNDSAAAAFSAQANANLTGITERDDAGTTSGNGGGLGIWDGSKANTGPTGNTTATVTNSVNAFMTIALRPPANGLTLNVPAGTVAGDVMVAAIAVRSAAVLITPPAGWSAQAATVQNGGNSSRQQLFYRVATGAEPASYTWLFDSVHAGAAGGIVGYSGVDTAAPIDAFGGNTTPQGADTQLQHRALSVNTTVADAMVVSAHAFGSSATWTAAGVNERVDVASLAVPNAIGISLAMYDATQAVAGPTGDRTASASGNGDTGSAHFLALRPFVPQPVLHWTMDQASWNGTAGEVVDLSGNGLHGVSLNGATTANATPAIAGSPGTCRYGSFDGVNDYLEVADNALLDVTDELTVMMWLRPTAYPTAGNLKSFVSKDANYEAHLTSTGNINWWWGGGALQLNSAGTVPLNQWTHVTLVYSRTGGYQRIFLNGVQDANTNNQTGALTTNNLPFQVGADQGFAGRNFAGLIDEVYVFRSALSAARIAQYMNATRACASTINHFAISHTGSGVGCSDQPITITAHDATHVAVDANALTVNLSTSNGKGTWTGIQAGGGTLNDPVAGDGAATYTFAVGSNSVTLLFRLANVAGTSETFSFGVSGGGFSELTGTASATDDPAFTMYGAGFRFRNTTDATDVVPTQISGKPSNVGWNAKTLRIQAINTDSVTGSCTNLFANQSQSVDLGAECNNPAACAGLGLSVNGTAVPTSNDNAGPGAAAYLGVSLNFDANSEADTVLSYPDAGLVSLHARFDLNTGVAGYEMVGSTNAFVVRPFGLAFRGANAATPIQHSSTAAGTLMAAAGDNFTMTVAAYRWSAGEDANNDGVPDGGVNITDNGATPNFAATAGVAAGANLPGVALGSVARGPACASAPSVALAGGAGTASDWCYSEAGNVIFTANVSDYLGAADADIPGSSALDGDAAGGYVGRFKPRQFAVTGAPTLVNRTDIAGCGASTFTYLNEELTLAFTLEARNTQGALTQNYTGAYAKLDLSSATNLNIGARSGATNLTGRVDASLAPTGSFTNGVANLGVRTGIRRATPDNPDGPFAGTQFGIAPNDNDPNAAGGVQMGAFNLDVDGNAVNDHFAVGPATELRFGRLWLQNAYGNGASVLPVPVETQYWNGSAFAVNGADSCTTLARSAISLTFAAPLAPCNTAVNAASVPFASGVGTLVLSAPGAGAQGSVLLTPNLGSTGGSYCDPGSYVAAASAPLGYLLGRWNDAANPDGDGNTAYDDKPGGRAVYGRYAQPRNFIFYRENY
ncbi:MAG TPA: LamG domain-containing protein [Burkholderiales bacterium]